MESFRNLPLGVTDFQGSPEYFFVNFIWNVNRFPLLDSVTLVTSIYNLRSPFVL